MTGSARIDAAPRRSALGALLALVCVLLVVAYLSGAHAAYVNIDRHSGDQSAYLRLTKLIDRDLPRVLSDGNRMVLYPAFQSLFIQPHTDDATAFDLGKRVNIALACALLAAMYGIVRRSLSPHRAVNFIGLAAADLWVYKAGYFQPELLYYFLSFCVFVLACEALERPGVLRPALLGVTAALAHLTKASILPAVVLFVVVRAAGALKTRERATIARCAVSLLIFAVTFLGTLSPYLRENLRRFGTPFYNVNVRYYFWCDSWREAKAFSAEFHDRERAPAPGPATPSLSNYVARHGAAEALARLGSGIGTEAQNFAFGMSGTGSILLLGALTAALLTRPRAAAAAWAQTRVKSITFAALYFPCYVLLYAWYTPISDAPRFVLSLFCPALFCVLLLSQRVAEGGGRSKVFDGAVSVLWLVEFLIAPLGLRGFVGR